MDLTRMVNSSSGDRKRLYFVFSFLAMVAAAVSVVGMLAVAWEPGGVVRGIVYGALDFANISPKVFFYLPIGVYLGLITALLLDSYKRIQGTLLVVVTLVSIPLVLLPNRILLEPLAPTLGVDSLLLTFIAWAVTLYAVGVTPESLRHRGREYPRVPTVAFAITALAVATGFVEAHLLSQSEGVAQHLIASVVLLFSLKYFTTYERDQKVIMIGPARSGKSAVFGGLHLYIRDNVDEFGESAFRVNHLRSSIESGEFPDPTQMAVQSGNGAGSSSGQPRLLELPYQWGDHFPKRVRFHAIDYPGEALESILADVVEAADRRSQGFRGEVRSDGGQDDFDLPFSSDNDDDGPFADDVEDRSSEQRDVEIGSNGLFAESSVSDHSTENQRRQSASSSTPSKNRDTTAGSSLFGSEEETGGTGPLSEALGNGDERNPMASWEDATEVIRRAENIDEMIPGIQGCLHDADRIVLTIPLDDFIAPVIERDNVPPYFRDRVIPPEEVGSYQRSQLRLINYQGREYAIKGFEREQPSHYLYWYEALRSVYPDTDFVVVGTMADWMLEDFRAEHPESKATLAEGYDDFCEHVLNEVVREQTPIINQVLGGRNKGRLYLLWYRIQNEEPPADGEELHIDTDGSYTVLKGAEQFMKRINQ